MLYSLLPSNFNFYHIPECDIAKSYILNDAQLAMIHNEITTTALAKLNIKFEISNPTAFAQTEAYHRGKMDALQYLLDCHVACLNEDK